MTLSWRTTCPIRNKHNIPPFLDVGLFKSMAFLGFSTQTTFMRSCTHRPYILSHSINLVIPSGFWMPLSPIYPSAAKHRPALLQALCTTIFPSIPISQQPFFFAASVFRTPLAFPLFASSAHQHSTVTFQATCISKVEIFRYTRSG